MSDAPAFDPAAALALCAKLEATPGVFATKLDREICAQLRAAVALHARMRAGVWVVYGPGVVYGVFGTPELAEGDAEAHEAQGLLVSVEPHAVWSGP